MSSAKWRPFCSGLDVFSHLVFQLSPETIDNGQSFSRKLSLLRGKNTLVGHWWIYLNAFIYKSNFKLNSMINCWGIFCKIALECLSVDFNDFMSTLIQAKAVCPQPTSHYPNQYWPGSPTPYGDTTQQCIHALRPIKKWPTFCRRRWKFKLLTVVVCSLPNHSPNQCWFRIN